MIFVGLASTFRPNCILMSIFNPSYLYSERLIIGRMHFDMSVWECLHQRGLKSQCRISVPTSSSSTKFNVYELVHILFLSLLVLYIRKITKIQSFYFPNRITSKVKIYKMKSKFNQILKKTSYNFKVFPHFKIKFYTTLINS